MCCIITGIIYKFKISKLSDLQASYVDYKCTMENYKIQYIKSCFPSSAPGACNVYTSYQELPNCYTLSNIAIPQFTVFPSHDCKIESSYYCRATSCKDVYYAVKTNRSLTREIKKGTSGIWRYECVEKSGIQIYSQYCYTNSLVTYDLKLNDSITTHSFTDTFPYDISPYLKNEKYRNCWLTHDMQLVTTKPFQQSLMMYHILYYLFLTSSLMFISVGILFIGIDRYQVYIAPNHETFPLLHRVKIYH